MTVKCFKFPRKQKTPHKPNVTDERSIKIFKISPFGDKYWNGWVPKGEHNTISEVKNSLGETIGDIEIGTDGFIEARFIYDGLFFKMKRYPNKECFIMLVGVAQNDDTKSNSEFKQQK